MFMRFLPFVVFALWIAFGVLQMAFSPSLPDAGPVENSRQLIPSRNIYNPGMAAHLNQELRDYWQKPDRVLELLGDLEGLVVADIGCGEGYFTLPLLDRVGPDGKVLATDIQQEVLDTLDQRIPSDRRDRIKLIKATTDEIGIDREVDLIFLVQVLAEVGDQRRFLEQLKAIMGTETRLVLIDSRHITDTSSGYTRPLNLKRLQQGLAEMGLVMAPEYREERFQFLPKQFFFVLTKSQEIMPLSTPAE
jgi:ubiquinone/menaquinone biosynthesis C-methylase UbiE